MKARKSALSRAIAMALMGSRRGTAAVCTAVGGLAIGVSGNVVAQELPVPAVNNWVGAGQASGVVSGNTLNIHQTSQNVSLNWQSFNIDPGGTVNFLQPSANSVALNRIFHQDPALIRGALNANGEVYLLSQGGIIFGETAQVNVRGLVASSLNITLSAELNGLANAGNGEPSFAAALNAAGEPVAGDITVASGARITTPAGGRVFMFAPNVTNEGDIKTPDGQTALAAGNKIYLTSNDNSIRGLVVEVGEGGIVTNGSATTAGTPAAGSIQADRGNVSLVGLAVNQLGRVSASTAVRSGGSIRLLARESNAQSGIGSSPLNGGRLTLGQGSITEANPDLTDKELTLDANPQPRGRIDLVGDEIFFRSDSLVSARSGEIVARASQQGVSGETATPNAARSSRIYVEAGSTLDVSGEFVDLPAERNSLTVRLQGSELRDSPVQRDSALRGQQVTVDVRRRGTTADGRSWVGTPLADLAEAAQGVRRSVGERSTSGGTVSFGSEGDVIIAQGSTIDVSGGGVRYADGAVQSTLLVRQGVITDIGSADPNLAYDGVFGSAEKVHERWGVIEEFRTAFVNGIGASGSPGQYFEGKDAGAVQLYGSRLVLDGEMLANVTRGEFQRAPTAAFTGAQRPSDQAPRGGQLSIGYTAGQDPIPDFGLSSVGFGIQPILPDIPAFDPLHDPLPELAADVTIPVHLFGEDKFTALSIAANGRLQLPAGVHLNLGPGGTLNSTSGEVDLAGQITARGGSVSLLTRDTVDTEHSGGRIRMTSGASIDVSGLWTNDTRDPKQPPMPFDRLLIDAGSIRLEAREFDDDTGGLILERGSSLDADGGAYVGVGGRVTAGRGGAISLLARRGLQAVPVDVSLAADISAYGLEQGGALTVQASAVCIAAVLCDGADAGTTAWFTPDYLRNAGFRSYSFVADGGSAVIADGTQVDLRQVNRILDTAFLERTDRADLASFTQLATLPDIQRRPVDLSVSTRLRVPSALEEIDDELFQTLDGLEMGTNAIISADPGARINFSSDTRLFVDGTISALAGTISLSLESAINGQRLGEFLASQSLWLGANAALLAPGATRIVEDGFGRRSGEVLAGGAVNLNARSGYVVADSGARIDVSGVTGELDLRQSGGANQAAAPVRTTVAADAGSIAIKAAEGILLAAGLDGSAAVAGARAGNLTIELNGTERNDDTDPNRPVPLGLPASPRTIVVTNENRADAIGDLVPGQAIGAENNGLAYVDPDWISDGGFGDVTLRSVNFERLTSPGRIRFDGDVSLSASRRLTLDAAGLESNGGHAVVHAPYVALGNQNLGTAAQSVALPEFVTRFGELEVAADFIDVVGNTRLLGLGEARFASTGDIRLRGSQIPGRTDIKGSLESTGDIELSARQIYAPTLNQFTVAVRDNPEGSIRIDAVGTPAPVLSAGSRLRFEAADIVQSGVLKAPLGEIVLDASRELTLEAGSITSTSLESQIVPFGRVEIGTDWVYGLDANGAGGLRLVFTEQANRPADPLPEQQVELRAPSVTLAEGAVIDQSGGGDLLAYEFQSGLSGSFDVLDSSVAPRNFAIVPDLDATYAPIDPQESLEFGLKPGESVEFVSDIPGLPAGRYALLPARYALLPGAFLITSVSGYSDLAPGAVLPYALGGSVLAGRRTFADGSDGDSRTSGFVVRTQADIAKLARYDTYRANGFADGFQGAALPRDAGSTRIAAGVELELGGSIRASGSSGGRGATVEITGDLLAVVADRESHTADENALLLEAEGLNELGAESLILGGTRSFDEDGAILAVSAQQVEVDSGARLVGPEVILAATGTVRVESGASVSGRGGSSEQQASDITVSGDGALLRVSSGEQNEFLRADANGAAGVLQVDEGATLGAEGSTLLSGSQAVRFEGALEMNRGSLAVDAARINLGAAGTQAEGFTLTSADLAGLGVDELRLSARDGVDVHQALDIAIDRLELRTPILTSHLVDGERARFAVDHFGMANPGFAPQVAPAENRGTLEIAARNLSLGTGEYAIAGFDSVTLAASDTLRALAPEDRRAPDTQGSLNVTGDLSLVAGRITGQSNANLRIDALGTVDIGRSGQAPTVTGERALGAQLSIAARSINHGGRIELGSGTLELRATGATPDDSVTLTATAAIDAAGSAERFSDQDVYVSAGNVRLVSDHGSVLLQAGSVVDVSAAAGGGDAGRLEVSAFEGGAAFAGTVHGAAHESAAGGSFSLDVGALDDFSSLNALLANAGFDGDLQLRARSGDLEVAATDTVMADDITLTADAGRISIAGDLDVSGYQAGSIVLNSRDDIGLQAGASLHARSVGAGNRGGEVQLNSLAGAVRAEQGSVIDVGAAGASAEFGGRVSLRVTREVAATLADTDGANDLLSLDGSVSGARRVDLEAYRRYTDTDGSLDAADVDPLRGDAEAFVDANGAAIRAALDDVGGGGILHLLPGVEIDTDLQAPDLRLGANWDLSGWRFNGEAGVLTLRAAGGLFFDASLSDGFNGLEDLNSNALPQLRSDDSWSYRLIAGADNLSANLLATREDPNAGGISLAPGTISSGNVRPRLVAVRTGTGSIELASAGDITLGNRASVIYTAGRDTGEGIRLGTGRGTLENRPYPQQGGDISIDAGGTLRGVAPDLAWDTSAYGNQLITPWLYRQGAADEEATGVGRRATGWTVAFDRFEQGIGALGGGDIDVVADGGLDNLSLSITSIGMQVGGSTAETSDVRVVGGGDLTVRAGGDIAGGVFYVGKGVADIRSDGSVVSGRVISDEGVPLHTMLALGDAQLSLQARGRVEIESVVNPTLLAQSAQQRNVLSNRNSFFSTYGDDSSVSLTSLAGDVGLFNNRIGMSNANVWGVAFAEDAGFEDLALVIYPPILQAIAHRGDVNIDKSLTLYPSAAGDLQIYADGTLHVNGALTMSDADPQALPTVDNPAPRFFKFNSIEPGLLEFAATPLHLAGDSGDPARLTARQGDIVLDAGGIVMSAKEAEFSAGRDISNLNALIQNVHENDVSLISAGRDLVYPSLRTVEGLIVPAEAGIDVQGPGKLLVSVGGDIDLGASRGISSLGDTANPALADQGADIIVMGGLNGHAPRVQAFADKYDVAADLATVLDKFYGVLRAAGRRNAVLPNEERSYADAFEAIETLFPDSDYQGSMDMFFSRVYTLDGGDIDVLMPGGGINIGLAAPPSSFGVTKGASQLGMVAQSFGSIRAFMDEDFEVNESRVFAADGGDILVWSSNGDIDAGRGAKTSISAPPPIINIDPETGAITVTFPPALTGSGIRTLTSTPGRPFGSVDLFTPRGVVDASEAGIETLGNLTIAAVEVLGTQNIKVGGVSTGVPVDSGGLAASLTGASSVSNSASSASADVGSTAEKPSQAPMSDAAMSFLEVFVLGFGEGVCDPKDTECLKRQQGEQQ